MIERRATPQELITYTSAPNSEGIVVNTYADPVEIKGDIQPLGRGSVFLAMMGQNNINSDMKVDFVPIRYTTGMVNNAIIKSGTEYFEIVQIAKWSRNWELLLQPWTGEVPS